MIKFLLSVWSYINWSCFILPFAGLKSILTAVILSFDFCNALTAAQEYKEGETDLNGALALAIRVMSKTMDATKLSPDKLELATLTRRDGKTVIKVLPLPEVQALIAEHEKKEAAEAAKAKPQAS